MFPFDIRNHEIICVGDLCADLIIPYGEIKNTISKMRESLAVEEQSVVFRSGGSVGNTAKVLGKLHQNPIFITHIGNDQAGQFLKQEMEKYHVKMDHAIASDKGSVICIAVLDENRDRTMFVWVPPWSGLDHYTLNSFSEEIYKKPAIIFSSGMVLTNDIESGNAILAFIERMKENNSILVFDLNIRAESYGFEAQRRQLFERVLQYSDVVLGSGIEEFGQLTGKNNMIDAVRAIANDHSCIIARDGSLPILIREGDRQITVKVEAVKPACTVGAGDTFDAAFLMALRKGYNIENCVTFANKIAGYMISREEHLAIPDNAESLLPGNDLCDSQTSFQ
ncbi:MAG: carbohydrate kinase family protein [Anaerolineae bacterium]|nr:carbohydrate kinase family protein [Anaerolineae bacterium]